MKVFAPVNIALIKYMGKEKGLPVNSSLSMTLDSVGTTTEITRIRDSESLEFSWDQNAYVPPPLGQEKAEKFLRNFALWQDGLKELNFDFNLPRGHYLISTQNNVPAGTGIATSASGFAALTLAWLSVWVGDQLPNFKRQYAFSSDLRRIIAKIAGSGSGSACRSFEGPFVEWHPSLGVRSLGGDIIEYTDFILIVDAKTKAVSSSDAHAKVKSSPLFAGRPERVAQRMTAVKRALEQKLVNELPAIVLAEALDMHSLFHTSIPPFRYQNAESLRLIEKFSSQHADLPSSHACVTLDAGANVHLFVPTFEEDLWQQYLTQTEAPLKFLKARGGKGAHFVDTSF